MWVDIVRTLKQGETKTGGPYYTWILDTKAREKNIEWKNVDIGANANIAYLLRLNRISCPPGLSEYIDTCITSDNPELCKYTS
jgi:predicted RNA-binding protein with PUA-like domain